MKNISELYSEACSIIEETCGEVIGDITDISINSRSQKRWGRCHHDFATDTFQLQISNRILADEVPYDSTLSVMVHEVLHACKGGQSHTGMWKEYANKVMEKYPELVITRCTSASFFGLEPYQKPKRVYTIECEKCGRQIHRARKNKVIKYPHLVTHVNCGGHFKRV